MNVHTILLSKAVSEMNEFLFKIDTGDKLTILRRQFTEIGRQKLKRKWWLSV